MDEGESILGSIYEEDNLEDIEMLDVEEGEVVEHNSTMETNLGQSGGDGDGDTNEGKEGSQSRNRKRRANKKKNKKRRSGQGQNFVDLNRFVMDTCRHLKEKKSYMVYTAVGCLGISALSDLVKEVDAIQTCGGQMTADSKRFRTGGGILWNIIKVREPAAYKEIMKKTREFEKQFRQRNKPQVPDQIKQDSQKVVSAPKVEISASDQCSSEIEPQNQQEQSNADVNRKPVHERIRVPVSYADLIGEDPKSV